MTKLTRRPLVLMAILGGLTCSCAVGAAVSLIVSEPPGTQHAYLVPPVVRHLDHVKVVVGPTT